MDTYIEQSELDVIILRVRDLLRDYAGVMSFLSEAQRRSLIYDIQDSLRDCERYPEALGQVWSLLCEAAE